MSLLSHIPRASFRASRTKSIRSIQTRLAAYSSNAEQLEQLRRKQNDMSKPDVHLYLDQFTKDTQEQDRMIAKASTPVVAVLGFTSLVGITELMVGNHVLGCFILFGEYIGPILGVPIYHDCRNISYMVDESAATKPIKSVDDFKADYAEVERAIEKLESITV